MLFFSERIKARNTLWIIGDDFVHGSARVNFKRRNETASYSARNFEIVIEARNAFSSHNYNQLSRLRNSLIKAINECDRLPKYILVILEDDIIRETNFADCGLAQYYERELRWLISEFRKSIDTIKDMLPNKAKSRKYPKILWISPSLHDHYANNGLRKRFCKI